MSTNYVYGTGRRKTAVARVRLLPGDGSMVVNGKPAGEYFGGRRPRAPSCVPVPRDRDRGPLLGQRPRRRRRRLRARLGAIRHGIARALLSAHPDARAALREAGLLTRDPRAKERKKYGLKRARKAPQYTKR